MGPHGNGRQRLPAPLFLLLGLAAALAYSYGDVAAFSLGLRLGSGFAQELKEMVTEMEKLVKKYERDVNFIETLAKEHKGASAGDKAKVKKRHKDWIQHCENRKEEVRVHHKMFTNLISSARRDGTADDKKEADAAEPKCKEAETRSQNISSKLDGLKKQAL